MANAKKMVDCPRCDNGTGFIRAFSGIKGGICFKCSGSGKVAASTRKPNKFSQINASHCATVEEAEAYRLAIFAERFPMMVDALNANQDARNIIIWSGNVKGALDKIHGQ